MAALTSNSPTLVTGGTGFLGRRLVERLLGDGRRVSILGRTPAPEFEQRGVRFIRASLDDAAAVRAACAGMESVFHVAAKVGVWGRYDDFFRINVQGTRALLEGCRIHGVKRLIYTSTPSVVYNGRDLAGTDESIPLTTACSSPYPLTKAIAEKEVLAANTSSLRTIALRPHLIWGVGDPHLVPRILQQSRTGRLRIIGSGLNRVDLVHIENAVDAHLLAEQALVSFHVLRENGGPASAVSATREFHVISEDVGGRRPVGGRAFFITNGEPVILWEWINGLLRALGERVVTRHVSLRVASAVGAACELTWCVGSLPGEPPMTRFVAAELAKHHWFDITAARRDLGYSPRVSMAEGTAELIESLRAKT